MIEVINLSKKFGEDWVLKNNSWKAGERKALGLLGPNGAGKSTTMKIMTGLLCSTEGQVLVDGYDVFKEPLEAKRRIGFLPETPPVYEDIKVTDYLGFICGLKSVDKKKRRAQMDMAIEKLSLNEVAFKYIGALSKGFKQRVGIAQALIGHPQILILDEPSVGLDPHQVFELRQIIKDLKSEHTIVLSTHVLSEVQQICDDVVILDKGHIKRQGALQEILNPLQGKCLVELKVKNISETLKDSLEKHELVKQVTEIEDSLILALAENIESFDEFVILAAEHKAGLISVQKKQAQLEELFIEVTKS